MNTELEIFIKRQIEMLGNLTITDSIDSETLTDICEEYHRRKLKLLGIVNVVVPKDALPYDSKCDEVCKFYCTKGNTQYPECLK